MTSTAIPARHIERQTQAADWLLRLQDCDLSDEVVAAWMAWCEADPLNRQAFDGMQELHALAGQLDPAAFERAVPIIGPTPSARRRKPLPRWAWAGGAMAACLVLAMAVGLVAPSMRKPAAPGTASASSVARLETARGKLETVRLNDGSQVQLGGRSALSVRYSPQVRLIVADSGEAFFKVAHNRARPFVVQAGPLTVTAVGTAFSVEREDNSVSVAVTEGVVEVRASPTLKAGGDQTGADAPPVVLRVGAGHRIRFDRGELTQLIEPADPEIATSWRDGRLEFKDEPLRLVVARVNRYSVKQIQISDPSIEDLRVTGTVYGDRVDAWLAGIEAVLPVRVERIDGDHVLIASATGGSQVKAAR